MEAEIGVYRASVRDKNNNDQWDWLIDMPEHGFAINATGYYISEELAYTDARRVMGQLGLSEKKKP